MSPNQKPAPPGGRSPSKVQGDGVSGLVGGFAMTSNFFRWISGRVCWLFVDMSSVVISVEGTPIILI